MESTMNMMNTELVWTSMDKIVSPANDPDTEMEFLSSYVNVRKGRVNLIHKCLKVEKKAKNDIFDRKGRTFMVNEKIPSLFPLTYL